MYHVAEPRVYGNASQDIAASYADAIFVGPQPEGAGQVQSVKR